MNEFEQVKHNILIMQERLTKIERMLIVVLQRLDN
jgi:hypothetical protein